MHWIEWASLGAVVTGGFGAVFIFGAEIWQKSNRLGGSWLINLHNFPLITH